MRGAVAYDLRAREIAKIHVAKKALGLCDESYREILFQEAGCRSAKDLDEAGRRRVLDRFRGLGFQELGGRRKNAANPQHSKIRYLWRDLHRAGAIENNSDKALDSYVRRMTGASSLRFLTSDQSWRLIEAMKRWLARYRPSQVG